MTQDMVNDVLNLLEICRNQVSSCPICDGSRHRPFSATRYSCGCMPMRQALIRVVYNPSLWAVAKDRLKAQSPL